jgi:hypothetical protein
MTEGLDQEDVLVLAQARGAADEENEVLLEAPRRGLERERTAMMGGRDGGGGGAVVVVGDEDDSNRVVTGLMARYETNRHENFGSLGHETRRHVSR